MKRTISFFVSFAFTLLLLVSAQIKCVDAFITMQWTAASNTGYMQAQANITIAAAGNCQRFTVPSRNFTAGAHLVGSSFDPNIVVDTTNVQFKVLEAGTYYVSVQTEFGNLLRPGVIVVNPTGFNPMGGTVVAVWGATTGTCVALTLNAGDVVALGNGGSVGTMTNTWFGMIFEIERIS